MTTAVAALVLFLADTSGPTRWPGPALPAERLGSPYSYLGSGEEQGLLVEQWWNGTLNRPETWHKSGGKAWLKVNDRTFVYGFHSGGEWRSDPDRRLVLEGGDWRERSRGR